MSSPSPPEQRPESTQNIATAITEVSDRAQLPSLANRRPGAYRWPQEVHA